MKNVSQLISILFIMSLLLGSLPLCSADDENIRIIQGALYINDEPDSNLIANGVNIKIMVSDGQNSTVTTESYSSEDDLNFGNGFKSIAEDETVNFTVEIDGEYQNPDRITFDDDTVDDGYITITSETIYHVNLYFTADTPYNPHPSNNQDDVDPSITPSWSFDDTGKDDITYQVYFDTENPPAFLENTTNTSIYPGDLEYNTTYYWSVNATDNSDYWTGDLWKFTTMLDPRPTADAGGDYTRLVDESIPFDASASTDDVSVTGYRWDWTDDDSYDTEWLTSSTTTHSYSSAFTGKVKLQVKDADGHMDTDTASVTIETGNNPPTIDLLEGPNNPETNTTIIINFSATDPDGDQITYRIDWDDDSLASTTTGASGTTISETHMYPVPGFYTVTVTASDPSDAETSDDLVLIVTEAATSGSTDDSDTGFPWIIVFILIILIAVAGVLFYLYQNDQLPYISKSSSTSSSTGSQSIKDFFSQTFQRNKSSSENRSYPSNPTQNNQSLPQQSMQSKTASTDEKKKTKMPLPLSKKDKSKNSSSASKNSSPDSSSEFKRL